MKRDLNRLANQIYDVLVVGGGIYGAFVAWDAALRGFSVALIEKNDFGGATSANSLKTIHGGLRYLQDGNLWRVRAMAFERQTWMRIAPHLVHPLPCLMPTSNKLTQHKAVLSVALAVNDVISRVGKPLADPQKRLPFGHVISREACLHKVPGLNPEGVTGGACWYDAQMYSSERLLFSVILSAARESAVVANYIQGIRFILKNDTITGLEVEDTLTRQRFDIRAKIVVNATGGGWAASMLDTLHPRFALPVPPLSTAMNLVTRQILPDVALGFSSRYRARDGAIRSRILFMSPWHQYSLIGTIHNPFHGHPEEFAVQEENIQAFVDEVNTAYPGANLSREDVYHIHTGFLPADPKHFPDVRLVRESQVIDHQQRDGIDGLISVIGVKYTTARRGAEEAVNLVSKKIIQNRICSTHLTPLAGGNIESFHDFLVQIDHSRPDELESCSARHLAHHYGTETPRIYQYLDENHKWVNRITDNSPTIQAEVIHAVREEMALKLSDVVQRRTELGAAGLPDMTCLQTCATLMAAELSWSETRRQAEIEEVISNFHLITR